MSQKRGYRPPAWADYVIKVLGLYNTKAKYIKAAAKGDLIKLIHIFEKFKLPFWQLLMKELIIVLEKLDLDAIKNTQLKYKQHKNLSCKYEWPNHRIFG